MEYNNEKIIKKKYLLSTKELNSTNNIKAILKSDIDSLKIEGRMKSPEYVGFITRLYRNLIDQNKKFDLEEETDKLKTLFNREFTKGHLFNERPEDLINPNFPNHIGLKIGEVINVTPKKITIKLDNNRVLNQQDSIRFLNNKAGFTVNYLYDQKDNLIKTSNDICVVDNKVDLKTNDIVCKTIDYNLMKSLEELPIKKIPISISVTAKVNEPLQVIVKDNENIVELSSVIVEESKTAPITKERIMEQLTKLGNSNFTCTDIDIESDQNIFISIKDLNDLRRQFVEKLTSKRENNHKDIRKKEIDFPKLNTKPTNLITVSVKKEDQLLAALELKISRIYTSDEDLYKKYKNNSSIYYALPRCSPNIKNNLKERNLVSDYFTFKRSIPTIGSYGLNVFNIYTLYYLHKFGLRTLTISKELKEEEVENLIKKYYDTFDELPNIEYIVYGRTENMIIKGNILSLKPNDYNYNLIDIKNRKFPVYFDNNKTYLLNYNTNATLPNRFIKKYCNLRIDLYNESKEETIDIIRSYQSYIFKD